MNRFALALVAVVALACTTAAFSKPGPELSVSPNFTVAHLGDYVTFTTTSAEGTWLQVQCQADGVLLFSEIHANFEGGVSYNGPFALGPTGRWQSGGASCEAELYEAPHGALARKPLAGVGFDVLP